MTGLDGQRMSTCTAELNTDTKAISIPKVMAGLASKFPWSMSEDVAVYDDPNCLHFVTPALQISCRQLASNHFPDVVSFLLSIKGGNVCVVPRKDLVSAISSAAIFATRGQNMNPSMHLKFAESSVKLSAENDVCGNYESEIPCIGNCNIEIGVQPSYLSDFLGSTNEESVSFLFGEKLDKAAPFEMRPGDGSSETYRYVVKPLYI
jgi:DNA polymerase III sliding clamp (beta) subunit (PCNA family)